jgi:prophage DNA circulation protein
MNATSSDEVLAIVDRMGAAVMSSAVDQTSNAGVTLRRSVGMMVVDYNMVNLPTFATVFGMCLDLSRQTGATLTTTDRVRQAALAETPVSLPAILTVNAVVRLTLASEARIVSGMTFRSRDEVEAIATALNIAFEQTEMLAADDHDADTYMALLKLHGDVTQYLADRGRALPRIINYAYQMVMPSLRMAQLVYADPSRSTELRDENSVVHPAFMPMTGKMLAV